jgi:hypothetical protein
MLSFLTSAAKVAGLTYRLLSTTTMIGFLAVGVYQMVKESRSKQLR